MAEQSAPPYPQAQSRATCRAVCDAVELATHQLCPDDDDGVDEVGVGSVGVNGLVIGVIIGVVGLAGLVYGLYGGVDTVGVVGLMTGTVGIGVITSRRGNLLDDCNSILLEDASVLPSEISFSLWFNAGEEDGLWLSSNVPANQLQFQVNVSLHLSLSKLFCYTHTRAKKPAFTVALCFLA